MWAGARLWEGEAEAAQWDEQSEKQRPRRPTVGTDLSTGQLYSSTSLHPFHLRYLRWVRHTARPERVLLALTVRAAREIAPQRKTHWSGKSTSIRCPATDVNVMTACRPSTT